MSKATKWTRIQIEVRTHDGTLLVHGWEDTPGAALIVTSLLPADGPPPSFGGALTLTHRASGLNVVYEEGAAYRNAVLPLLRAMPIPWAGSAQACEAAFAALAKSDPATAGLLNEIRTGTWVPALADYAPEEDPREARYIKTLHGARYTRAVRVVEGFRETVIEHAKGRVRLIHPVTEAAERYAATRAFRMAGPVGNRRLEAGPGVPSDFIPRDAAGRLATFAAFMNHPTAEKEGTIRWK